MKYENVIRAVLARPWAIDPDSLAWAAVLDVLSIRASGGTLDDQEIEARLAAAARSNGPRSGGTRAKNIAVLPVYGMMGPRSSLMARSSGGTSAESIRDDFRAALADDEIDGIVFDVDSPGGVVEGVDELADEIRAARGTKPIAAVANHLAASAAYWAMSGVDELVATPSASVGSIGVFTAHQDVSAAMEKAGVKTTLVSAGKFKVEGNQYEALADEARAALQESVDAWYGTMTGSIAKGRNVPVATVRDAYGEGRVLRASKALSAGMVDRVDSLENTIRRVARGAVGPRSSSAVAADRPYVVLGSAPGPDVIDGEAVYLSSVEAGSAPSFVARIEAASAEVRAIGALAARRAALRASDGREPSVAETLALAELRSSLAVDQEPAEDPEETPEPTEAPVARKRGLELLDAALSGGYRLPV